MFSACQLGQVGRFLDDAVADQARKRNAHVGDAMALPVGDLQRKVADGGDQSFGVMLQQLVVVLRTARTDALGKVQHLAGKLSVFDEPGIKPLSDDDTDGERTLFCAVRSLLR